MIRVLLANLREGLRPAGCSDCGRRLRHQRSCDRARCRHGQRFACDQHASQRRMGQEEFESAYASGDDRWRADGMVSIECYCGDRECPGWRMILCSRLEGLLDLGQNTADEVARARERMVVP